MTTTKYQVFVSSTFRDLVEERRAVIQTLLEMDCVPAGMELFQAADDSAWKLIERVIASCDYYVLIVGGRYGSTDSDGVSFTEREYDFARSIGIPIVAFLHGDTGKIPAEMSEMEPVGRERLSRFRQKVQDAHHCKYWHNASQLEGHVAKAMNAIIRDKPRVGWIRGDLAKTVEEVERVAKIQERIRELENELSKLRSTQDDGTSRFAQGSSRLDVIVKILRRDNVASGYTPRVETGATRTIPLTWDELFKVVAEALVKTPHEWQVLTALSDFIMKKQNLDGDLNMVEEDSKFTIKTQLLALRLISVEHFSIPKGNHTITETHWRLTPKGEAHFAALTAIKADNGND